MNTNAPSRREPSAAPIATNREPIERAKRLYADARQLEQISTNQQAKEIAGGIALLALDLLAEARAER